MVNITQDFELVLITYQDVKGVHPDWSDVAIEDYLARGRNLDTVAESVQDNTQDELPDNSAQLFELQQRIGSGDPLKSDETGFTVDTTRLTVDMTEA